MLKNGMLVVSVLFVFCCPLVSHALSDEAAMMTTAKAHYQDGGYYYASTWLERILRKWPDTAQREEILVMMAKSYAATGREDKAARTVKTLLKDYPQAAGKLDRDILKSAQEPSAAAAKSQDEVKAPVAAQAPVKPEAAAPAAAKDVIPAVAAVATPAPALSVPVALPVDAVKAEETETACRDTSASVPGTYAIEVGEFIGKNALVKGKKGVKKAGLMPVVGPGGRKMEVMLRIQAGEFSDEGAARKMLNKLRKVNVDQFMLKDKGGTFRVYAGSYFEHQAALDEQKRLSRKGLRSELKEATVPVSTYVINAGCFATEQVAKEKLAELERLGLKGKVLPPQ